MTAYDPAAADPADAELAKRLAEAMREVEAAQARLTEARALVGELEQAMTAARAIAPSSSAQAAQAAVAAQTAAAAKVAPPAEPAPESTAAAAAPAAADDTPPPTEAERNAPRELTEAEQKIDAQRRALVKRGFRRDDLYYHKCPACSEQAVEKYALVGKPGGRDIDLCLACGSSWSWRRRPEREDREQDVGFDIATFLRM